MILNILPFLFTEIQFNFKENVVKIINHPIFCHLATPIVINCLIPNSSNQWQILLSYRKDILDEKMEVEKEEFSYYLFKVIQSTFNGAQRIYSYMNLEPFSLQWNPALSLVVSPLKFSKLK